MVFAIWDTSSIFRNITSVTDTDALIGTWWRVGDTIYTFKLAWWKNLVCWANTGSLLRISNWSLRTFFTQSSKSCIAWRTLTGASIPSFSCCTFIFAVSISPFFQSWFALANSPWSQILIRFADWYTKSGIENEISRTGASIFLFVQNLASRTLNTGVRLKIIISWWAFAYACILLLWWVWIIWASSANFIPPAVLRNANTFIIGPLLIYLASTFACIIETFVIFVSCLTNTGLSIRCRVGPWWTFLAVRSNCIISRCACTSSRILVPNSIFWAISFRYTIFTFNFKSWCANADSSYISHIWTSTSFITAPKLKYDSIWTINALSLINISAFGIAVFSEFTYWRALCSIARQVSILHSPLIVLDIFIGLKIYWTWYLIRSNITPRC